MNRYLNTLLGVLGITLLGVVVFSRIVNPYAIFAAPAIEGVNAYKPETAKRERISKAYQVRHLKPEAIIIGTSRALNLPAEHSHWQGMRSFNLALSSSSIYEQWRYLQHAQAQHALQEVVIGLDYGMFVDTTQAHFSESRLATTPAGDAQPLPFGIDYHDLLPAILSFDALRSSVLTLQSQGDAGQDRQQSKLQRIYRSGGHHRLFREVEYGLMVDKLSNSGRTQLSSQLKGIGSLLEPGTFRKLLRFAHHHGLKLHLFISPVHARFLETLRLTEGDATLNEWRRALVVANEEEARMAGAQAYPLWDMSGYSTITTEPLPPLETPESAMFGYWEGSHYSPAVGRIILDHLFAEPAVAGADFAVPLTGANLEERIAQLHQEGTSYRESHPQDMAELMQMWREAGAQFRTVGR